MMDICDELEAKASTVHGGAFAAMHKARNEIQRLRAELDEARKDAQRLEAALLTASRQLGEWAAAMGKTVDERDRARDELAAMKEAP